MTYKESLNIQNFQLGLFEGDGAFDMPIILPFEGTYEACDFLGFGEKPSEQNKYWCHFFLDDYRFQRVWNQPTRYIEMLRQFKYVLAPDFSMFVDYPKALAMYNCFRKHWCARYWQENGINVIPVVNWMFEDSYDWCFDGDPHNAVVAVSSKGVNNSKEMIDMFRKGYEEMESRLQPSQVLWFGKYCLEHPRENVIMCRTTFEDRIEMLRRNHSKGAYKVGQR